MKWVVCKYRTINLESVEFVAKSSASCMDNDRRNYKIPTIEIGNYIAFYKKESIRGKHWEELHEFMQDARTFLIISEGEE